MNSNEIFLPRKLTNQLWHLAQQNPEQEICGLIAADNNGIPNSCYVIDNRAANPENSFELDSSQQIAAMRNMREQQQTLYAIFHSHPHSAAIPSPTDLRKAAYPEAIHLIISLSTKGVLELRGYRYQETGAQPLKLRLIETL